MRFFNGRQAPASVIRARAAAWRVPAPRQGRSLVSARSSHPSAASPLSAKRARPLKGRIRPPGDKSISHRAFLFGLLACGETKVEGLLEGDDVLGTGKACQASGAEIERLAPGPWRIRGPGIGALPRPARTARFRQRRHRLPADDGRRRRPRNHRDLRRRRLAAQAADAAHPRSAQAHGRAGRLRGRRRPLPDRAQGRPRSRADRISHARRLGADQIGGPARRPQRAGRDHSDRGSSVARPYREDAHLFRRGGRGHARGQGGGSRSSADPNCVQRP